MLRGVAVLLALAEWVQWSISGIAGLRNIIDQRPSASTDTWWSSALQLYEVMAVTLVALVLLAIADGSRAVGLRPRRAMKRHVSSFVRFLRGPFLFGAGAGIVFGFVLTMFPPLVRWAGTAYGGAPPLWWMFSTSVATAFGEEVVLLAVVFRVLDYVPVGSRTLARTTGGIFILAAMRMVYHVYAGVGVVTMLPVAFLVPLLYRRDRILWPAIAIHALFDIMVGIVSMSRALARAEFIMIVVFAMFEIAILLGAIRTERRNMAES